MSCTPVPFYFTSQVGREQAATTPPASRSGLGWCTVARCLAAVFDKSSACALVSRNTASIPPSACCRMAGKRSPPAKQRFRPTKQTTRHKASTAATPCPQTPPWRTKRPSILSLVGWMRQEAAMMRYPNRIANSVTRTEHSSRRQTGPRSAAATPYRRNLLHALRPPSSRLRLAAQTTASKSRGSTPHSAPRLSKTPPAKSLVHQLSPS